MLDDILRNWLNLPYPVARWLADFLQTLHDMAVTPAGIVVSAAFLMAGYLHIRQLHVSMLAGLATLGLLQWQWQGWAAYSSDWQQQKLILVSAASLCLCLLANYIGRRLRPAYI